MSGSQPSYMRYRLVIPEWLRQEFRRVEARIALLPPTDPLRRPVREETRMRWLP
jgi:hypothetical protein